MRVQPTDMQHINCVDPIMYFCPNKKLPLRIMDRISLMAVIGWEIVSDNY